MNHRPATHRSHRNRTPQASQLLVALEPRIMFDAAAAVAVDHATEALTGHPASITPPESPAAHVAADVDVSSRVVNALVDSLSPPAIADIGAERVVDQLFVATAPDGVLTESMAASSSAVRQFLESTSDEILFTLFSGGKSQPDAAWLAHAQELRAAVRDGALQLSIVQADGFDQPLAIAAFAPKGPGEAPTLFVSRNGFGQLDTPDATRTLIEEYGHAIDCYLNAEADSVGDEGERFAAAVLGLPDSQTSIISDDKGIALHGDRTYAIEYALYDFVNAYAMVYDLNNNGAVVGSTGETDAAKEQSSHNFNTASLGAVKIDDYNYNSKYFSGNDVNAIGLNIAGNTYYGWISRPIKSGGVVRGFYFWTDTSFTNLQLAQADGNQDGDSNTADNKGFVLVVDQTWFNNQITTTTSYTINNGIDGNLGAISVDTVGSSSDRVDSALNALIDGNVSPVATSDTASGTPSGTASTNQGNAALEQGYNTNTSTVITATINGTGNALANDTDANNNTLSVTTVTSKSTGATTTATSAGANLVGKYGTLTIKSDGNWTYAPDNTNATINALLGGALQEQFSYTASDGKGGASSATLTVQINGSNDAPVAANDYTIAKEITTSSNTGFTATGSVLTNDTDVDSGDTKAIQGLALNGAATVGTVNVTSASATLSFTGDNGFTANLQNRALYVNVGGTYRAVYSDNGTTQVTLSSKTDQGNSNWLITLNAKPAYYFQSTGVYTQFTDVAAFFTTNPSVGFEASTSTTENTSGMKTATVAVAQSTGSTTISNLSSISGTIASGMTVSGTGVPTNTTISSITYTNGAPSSIVLDKELTSTAGGAFTFTKAGSVATTVAGAHGSLILNADGAYTYTPTTDNASLSSGQSAIEVFDYTMRDTAGVQSSSKLYITVYGSGTNDPNLSSDAGTSTETGTSVGSNATGNVLTNDAPGTGGVVSTYSKADGSGTVAAGNTLTGTYGTLTISAAGAYTYTPDNANATVNALLNGSSLTETFLYKVTNTASGVSYSRLVITINGANDAPVATADTAVVQEDGTLLASGTVLINDTDVDSGDT
ncbi:MAG TPA: VCBS domain-containing protein, partial [Rhodocyclaceae bacterium]|nr:VCBS domain-containing protein [Rhodocyclaceae bacterium]